MSMNKFKSKIKKGDTVVLTAGKDKGREGQVLMVKPKKHGKVAGFKVYVEKANLVKKHLRGNPQKQQEGGIFETEAPIDISNVAILNRQTGKADRIGYKTLEDGRKVRIYKSSGEVIDI